MNETQILVCAAVNGIKLFNYNLKNKYPLNEEPDFHLLKGEDIFSMIELSNQKYLCSVKSGSL